MDYDFSLNCTPQNMRRLLAIYETNGKYRYYQSLIKKNESKICERVSQDNLDYFQQILHLDLPLSRQKSLLKKKDPKKNSEKTFLHFVDIYLSLQDNSLVLTPNNVIDIANKLFGQSPSTMSQVSNGTRNTVFAASLRLELEQYMQEFYQSNTINKYEYLFNCAVLLNHLVNNAFFKSNPQEICYLLLSHLLVKKFSNLRYYPLYKVIVQFQNELDEAFHQSEYYYKKNIITPTDLYSILLKIMEEVNNQVTNFVNSYQVFDNQAKAKEVEAAIDGFENYFTKEDVREHCPYVSDSTIDQVLRSLQIEGRITSIMSGRSAKWQVTHKSKVRHKIQRDLFS